MQRYKCLSCAKLFQSTRRNTLTSKLWKEYVWKKQRLSDLAEAHGRGVKWVRKKMDTLPLQRSIDAPHPIVLGTDTTFFGREYGVCVFRNITDHTNIWWNEVDREIMSNYHYGRKILEDRGWTFLAAVVDGRRGFTAVFKDIPVQICQFHQVKQVTKYLTRRPETLAGQELRWITLQLKHSTEEVFTKLLSHWYADWKEFISEKTYVTGTKHWYYTHRKVRSAYKSLERNLPYLFTYLKYPELKIPNTTNSLDGSFSHLKAKLTVHRGIRKDRRYKMISEILRGEGGN